MSDSTRTNRDESVPASKSADCRHPRASLNPICYQMQSDKHLLSGNGRGLACGFEASSGNRMPPCLLSEQQHTVVDLDRVRRVALMVTPHATDSVIDQAWEAVSTIRAILKQQSVPMTVTMQTVFVRSADDIPTFRNLFQAYFGDRTPTTNFIVQPPCDGQALAIEAWASGGDDVDIHFPAPDVVTVSYDDLALDLRGRDLAARRPPRRPTRNRRTCLNSWPQRLEIGWRDVPRRSPRVVVPGRNHGDGTGCGGE